MTTHFDFTTERGIPMRVVLLAAGEENPRYPAATSAVPTVEFYDRRFTGAGFTPDGQFTGGRYYLSTLNESLQAGRGLTIHTEVPTWTLTAGEFRAAMVGVLTRAFLGKVLQEQ